MDDNFDLPGPAATDTVTAINLIRRWRGGRSDLSVTSGMIDSLATGLTVEFIEDFVRAYFKGWRITKFYTEK